MPAAVGRGGIEVRAGQREIDIVDEQETEEKILRCCPWP